MIDSFNPNKYIEATIEINEETRHIWDIGKRAKDKKNFTRGFMNGKVFIVRKNNPDRFIKILSLIDTYISYLKKLLSENMSNFIHHPCYNEIVNFVKTKHTVQEISEQDTFEGINKPEDIVYCSTRNDGLIFQKDNKYRAGRRLIMLRIRNKDNSKRSWVNLKKLLLHELAHTMCNHITYREEGNHEEDFYRAEEFLTKISEHPFIQQLEEEYRKI